MYLPEYQTTNKYRNYINAFGGYNHNPVISESEFYDMKNMTLDMYPVIASREPRVWRLQTASEIFDVIKAKIRTEHVKESLSIEYKIYEITFDAVAGARYRLNYSADETVMDTEIEITYYSGSYGKKYAIVNRNDTDIENMNAPENCVQIKVKITVHKAAGVEWDEEHGITDFQVQKCNERIRGMLVKNGKLAYMIRNKLYWNGETVDFSSNEIMEDESPQKLISFGAYILIFPLGRYLNTNDISDYGKLGAKTSIQNIQYFACNLTGAEYEYTLSKSAPENPEDGKYWMRKSDEGDALYRWSETMAMWVAVGTTYIKIKGEIDDFKQFETGDAIHISGSSVSDLNGVNTIAEKGDDYIVVTGIIRESITENSEVEFERSIPELDHVCVANNRVWGCHYGEGTNEIYACKLGDPKNWYSYQGTSQDSYAVSLGDDGVFTGACTYQGYPMFFKENNVYRIYGNYPAAYQLMSYNCRGVQKGSSKSIAIVDEYLVYKSKYDVCVFSGSYPKGISDKLGKQKFTECAAGSSGGKYYASMKDENGDGVIFVYDFRSNTWAKDETMKIEEFIGTTSGELYGRTETGIICFGNENEDLGLQMVKKDDEVEWFAEFGTYGFDTPEKKYVKGIKIRAAVDFGAKLKLDVCYDDNGKWNEYWIDKGSTLGDGKIKTYEIPVIPVNCDTMKMRISGKGKVEIYSISREVEAAV